MHEGPQKHCCVSSYCTYQAVMLQLMIIIGHLYINQWLVIWITWKKQLWQTKRKTCFQVSMHQRTPPMQAFSMPVPSRDGTCRRMREALRQCHERDCMQGKAKLHRRKAKSGVYDVTTTNLLRVTLTGSRGPIVISLVYNQSNTQKLDATRRVISCSCKLLCVHRDLRESDK